jgi:hypothetical protein
MKKAFLFLMVAVALTAFYGCATTGGTTGGTQAAATTPAAGDTVMLWGFESNTTDGWHGAGKWADACVINADPKFVKEGKYSMKIESKGCKGWEQNIAQFDGPFNDQFGKLKSITMDVFVPPDSIKGLEYSQIFLVISGAANSWYQIPQGLKPGWNSLKYVLESANIDGDLWHAYFVFNSGGAFSGPVYIDNVVGNLK